MRHPRGPSHSSRSLRYRLRSHREGKPLRLQGITWRSTISFPERLPIEKGAPAELAPQGLFSPSGGVKTQIGEKLCQYYLADQRLHGLLHYLLRRLGSPISSSKSPCWT